METERTTIKNRAGLKLVIQVDRPDSAKDVAFIAHGKGGFMGQKHIIAFAEAFEQNGFITVRFDATHALGESEGDMIDVTYDSYVNDLEDVINWARGQAWFREPFSLCGQSMGAQSTAWYAEQHPDEIDLLAPIAPTVNYELWAKTMDPAYLKSWKERGYVEEPSRSKPGAIGRSGWALNESFKKFDLLPNAGKLTMPVFFMVGEFDKPCPEANQKILYDKIPSNDKTFVKIAGAEHSFRNAKTGEHGAELAEAKAALSNWLKKHKEI